RRNIPERYKSELRQLAESCTQLRVIEFTDQMMSYMNAADVVVAIAGYNTLCEILSLRKRAVIVPRIKPVQEQKIRAERMARLGLCRMIHPADMTPRTLMEAVRSEMDALRTCPHAPASLQLEALPRIRALLRELVSQVAD